MCALSRPQPGAQPLFLWFSLSLFLPSRGRGEGASRRCQEAGTAGRAQGRPPQQSTEKEEKKKRREGAEKKKAICAFSVAGANQKLPPPSPVISAPLVSPWPLCGRCAARPLLLANLPLPHPNFRRHDLLVRLSREKKKLSSSTSNPFVLCFVSLRAPNRRLVAFLLLVSERGPFLISLATPLTRDCVRPL